MSRDLVFEIGTEEIPSTPLYAAIEQLAEDAARLFGDARLSYADIDTFGSPRRLVLFVRGVADAQSDRTLRHRGPAVKVAFDAEGKPTKAAEGFARGKGVDVASLVTEEDETGAYVYAVVEERGGSATEVLPGLLARLGSDLVWPRSMRWGDGDARFARPVRWLLALLGDEVVPVEFAGLRAGRVTYGHRFLAPGAIEVARAAEYEDALVAAYVQPRQERRAELVDEGVRSIMRAASTQAVVPEKTLAEVVNLVEWPTVGVGVFDEAFLEIPREVLETAMEGHQRYFPVEALPEGEGQRGCLRNEFVVVHNGDPDLTDSIVRGHERVIRARLADAAFFYREDLARPLEGMVERLDSIVFQDKLGTLGEKVARVERLTAKLAERVGAPPDETAFALRAAHLAKADLVSSVVIEFPALQGIMGGYYAEAAGEERSVAIAIVDHYRPRFAGDALPATLAGRLVAIADKLDSIAGIFAAGLPPTGSADPFALRRGAIGVLQMLLDGVSLKLDQAVDAAIDGLDGVVADLDRVALAADVSDFLRGRLEVLLKDRGIAYDTVAAVLAVAGDDPADALARAVALQEARDKDPETFEDLSVAFTRAKNLAQEALGTSTVRDIMGAEEAVLLDALENAQVNVEGLERVRSYPLLVQQYAALRAPIDVFFDDVLVMDPDDVLRTNRLKLLNRLVALFERFADFRQISG